MSCSALAGRKLEKWAPDDGADSSQFHLDGTAEGWDQFAVNEEKFNVVTSFQEDVYTTKLDRTNCGISEDDAQRIAQEIELGVSNTTNFHLLEERGAQVDDSGVCIGSLEWVVL